MGQWDLLLLIFNHFLYQSTEWGRRDFDLCDHMISRYLRSSHRNKLTFCTTLHYFNLAATDTQRETDLQRRGHSLHFIQKWFRGEGGSGMFVLGLWDTSWTLYTSQCPKVAFMTSSRQVSWVIPTVKICQLNQRNKVLLYQLSIVKMTFCFIFFAEVISWETEIKIH